MCINHRRDLATTTLQGGENCLLHGDASSEWLLSEIVGAAPLPGQRNANMESLYEYGSRAGFWRLHRLLTKFKAPVTVYAVGMALERNPEAANAMVGAATHALALLACAAEGPARAP